MNKRNLTDIPKFLRAGNEQLTFGRQIALKRTHMGLTQEELAEKLNVSKSAIAKWETDRGYPDRDNLFDLATVLDLELINPRSNPTNTSEANQILNAIIKILELHGYEIKKPEEFTQSNQK